MVDDPFDAFTAEIDAETAELLQQAGVMFAAAPPLDSLTVEEMRINAEQRSIIPSDRLEQGRDMTIPGPDGDIPLRYFVPDDAQGLYLYIHGGGWVGGHHDRQDIRLWDLAQKAGVTLVSVGYRLAPENPYPAGPDDCEAAALWMIHNAKAEFGTDRIVIGGESAGAHLSAVTALRMRDRHGYTGFAGAELRYGLYDLRRTPSVRLDDWTPLGGAGVKWLSDHFVPEKLHEEPDVSPLFAALHDLPPALFSIGTKDSLVDDSLFMWARWKAAGNDATLKVYPGGLHAFDMFANELGRRAVADFTGFIRDCVRQ